MKQLYLKPKNWWRNVSVSHKLNAVVGVMALLIAIELLTLLFAMNTLSAVRALVGGEGLWSKAQKNAILEIKRYSRSRDEMDYQAFLNQLSIPIGDHKARLELMKPVPDLEKVRQGFIEGQIHPKDIDPVIKLLTRFHQVHYVNKAVETWSRGDELIHKLIDKAGEMHYLVSLPRSPASDVAIELILAEIFKLNDQLTVIENEFSSTLGEASRWLESLLMIVLLIAVATVESCGLFLTITFSRSLTKVLNELQQFATNVGRGDFTKSVPVRSGDELGRLAMALNTMAEELRELTSERQLAEKANRIKSLFLANMSHEIRTPLNAILGFVELLKDPSIRSVERKKYLGIIERTGYGLASIINDILDLSKVEAGKLEIEKSLCSLPQIIRDLHVLLKLRCDEKGISLEFQSDNLPDQIATDPMRLKQVLFNIIGNAVKFTNVGKVSAAFRVENSKLICTVKDTGIGISSEHADKLFRPFSQIESSTQRKFGGTGLGLILSKRLAELLGGDVVLEKTEAGHGSVFVVSVLLEDTSDFEPTFQELTPIPRASRLLRNRRILLVEDSIDNQLLAQEFLTREGAEVEVANNGHEALEAVRARTYDAILMDMQMPVLDGYSAATKLREMGCEIPIIALTAHAMKADVTKCLKAGCTGYLSKPFRREALIAMIMQYLKQAA